MHDDILLGKETQYVFHYDKTLIFPIERAGNRERLNMPSKRVSGDLPFYGLDTWTAFELSWLNMKGKPQVAIAEFIIPANSKSIVESKSFKLYLNSFNQTKLPDMDELQKRLTADLSEGFGAEITVNLFDVNEYPLGGSAIGKNIDDLDIDVEHYEPNATILKIEKAITEETINSHLLKSNCPVTGQPDWATVVVSYKGTQINHAAFLKYIISYRNHDDFHEHCVEQIFCDLQTVGDFEALTVTARYTRRGGLDINPTRSLHPVHSGDCIQRLARQ
jgi:7-cyano-7-deazaguanine reductase